MTHMDSSVYERLINSSLRFVSIRPRSEKELWEYLGKKQGDTETVEKVMGRLAELGYCDDEKFARWLIDSRRRNKPKGDRVIRQELLSKGVVPEIIASCLVGSDPHELAQKSLLKKLPVWDKLPKSDAKNKAYGYLTRQGFGHDIIAGVIDEIWGKSYNREK